MQWYHNQLTIEGFPVTVKGHFENSTIKITAEYEEDLGHEVTCLTIASYEKPIQLWAHQEILAEDILSKYLGKIKKIEQNVPHILKIRLATPENKRRVKIIR